MKRKGSAISALTPANARKEMTTFEDAVARAMLDRCAGLLMDTSKDSSKGKPDVLACVLMAQAVGTFMADEGWLDRLESGPGGAMGRVAKLVSMADPDDLLRRRASLRMLVAQAQQLPEGAEFTEVWTADFRKGLASLARKLGLDDESHEL